MFRRRCRLFIQYTQRFHYFVTKRPNRDGPSMYLPFMVVKVRVHAIFSCVQAQHNAFGKSLLVVRVGNSARMQRDRLRCVFGPSLHRDPAGMYRGTGARHPSLRLSNCTSRCSTPTNVEQHGVHGPVQHRLPGDRGRWRDVPLPAGLSKADPGTRWRGFVDGGGG